MLTLPFWADALIGFAAKLVARWLADRRAEQALRDLGARTEALAATARAEAEEARARAAGDAAAAGPDDPRDLRT